MNYIDFIILITLILLIGAAIQKGFILSVADLICWIGSLLMAGYANPTLSELLNQLIPSAENWSRPFAFIFSAILFKYILDGLSALLLAELPNHYHFNLWNKVLGFVPGLINGVLWVGFLATILYLFPVNSKIPKAVEDSRLAGPVMDEIQWLGTRISRIFIGDKGSSFLEVPHTNAGETIKLPYKVTDPTINPVLEAQMLVLINQERRLYDLKPLEADPEIQLVARKHSADMFIKGYFSHTNLEGQDPFDRIAEGQVSFRTAGENLALAQSLKIAHEGLMKSPGHRANILNPSYGRVGIGIQDGGIYGLMITQNFRN